MEEPGGRERDLCVNGQEVKVQSVWPDVCQKKGKGPRVLSRVWSIRAVSG